MQANVETDQSIVIGEVRRWRLVAHRFCLLLPWPHLRYDEPSTRASANPEPALRSLKIMRVEDGQPILAARISITDEEYGQGELGFRFGFKDIQVDVYDEEICGDLLREFAKWYSATGKMVDFVPHGRCAGSEMFRYY